MIEIQPIRKPLDVTIEVPGSKSYTNRALLVAALARGASTLTGALFSDDTRYMCNALQKLGVEIDADEKRATFDVQGMVAIFRFRVRSFISGTQGPLHARLPPTFR